MDRKEKWLKSNIEKFGSIEAMKAYYSKCNANRKNVITPEGFRNKELAKRAGALGGRRKAENAKKIQKTRAEDSAATS
jgi:hypothetical protein